MDLNMNPKKTKATGFPAVNLFPKRRISFSVKTDSITPQRLAFQSIHMDEPFVVWALLAIANLASISKTLNTTLSDNIDTTRVLAAPAKSGTITFPLHSWRLS